MTSTRLSLLALVFGAVTLAACGGNETNRPDPAPAPAAVPTAQPAAAPAPAPTPEPVATYDGPPLEVAMTPVGNEMKFAQTEFTAHPGQTVRLRFENIADNPAMSHNVVVVKTADVVNEVGQAAMSAADTEFIPASKRDLILAYTPLAAPGETVEVEFTAPSVPGDYPYICTFPGHYLMMKGTMHVVG